MFKSPMFAAPIKKALLPVLTFVLAALLFSSTALAAPSINFTTNGNANNYNAGATLVVYGQITNGSHPLDHVDLMVRVTLADSSVYKATIVSDANGYFNTRFNLPGTAGEGQKIKFIVSHGDGDVSEEYTATIQASRIMNFLGYTFPAYSGNGNISQTVDISTNKSQEFRLMFQGNVNYFNNQSSGFGTLGPNTKNADCITMYEDGTGKEIKTKVNLISSGGDGSVNYYDKDTLVLITGSEKNSLSFSVATQDLKADTVYRIVISGDLSNNSSNSLKDKQTIYFKTSPAQPGAEYTITILQPAVGGIISTTPAGKAATGQAVSLGMTIEDGYTFSGWDVKRSDGQSVTVTDNKFTMPAANVTVSATLKKADEIPPGTTSPSGGGISGTGTGPAPSTMSILDAEVPLSAIEFVDVPASHWAHQYIMYLADKGFVSGKTDTLFAPSEPITRAEFITILARMSGDTLPTSYSGPFTDVAPGSYYEQAVAWAINNGVANGTSETTFSPNRRILRQEMATIIVRYAANKNFNFLKYNEHIDFTDSAQIHSYAHEPVSVMQQADLINGYEDGTFRPLNNATRAEAAKILALLHHFMNE